ncbi:MAG: hypothetical protein AB1898_19130 [Acidobacteriota bacterium]
MKSPQQAARDLALRLAETLNPQKTLSLKFDIRPGLSAGHVAEMRAWVESALGQQGIQVVPASPAAQDVRITVSSSFQKLFLSAQFSQGSQDRVLMESFGGWSSALRSSPLRRLRQELLWTQSGAILDVLQTETQLVVLEPRRVVSYAAAQQGWVLEGSVEISSPRPLPRDPRGRLKSTANGIEAYLPDLTCRGTLKPAVELSCQAGEGKWPLQVGTEPMMAARLVSGRNFFDGTVQQGGKEHSIDPFFFLDVARPEEQGIWFVSRLDGGVTISDGPPVAGIKSVIHDWGSDLAVLRLDCGGEWYVLASGAAGNDEPDSIRAFLVSEGAATPASESWSVPGSIRVLRALDGRQAALLVAHSATTGAFAAYRLSILCDQ